MLFLYQAGNVIGMVFFSNSSVRSLSPFSLFLREVGSEKQFDLNLLKALSQR